MRTPLPVFIYSVWFVILLGAVVLISIALVSGWRKANSPAFWKGVKLCSALLGVVSLGLLMLTFEATTRAMVTGKARDVLLLYFIDTKAFIAVNMATACSEPDDQNPRARQLTCWDMKNIDGQINIAKLHEATPFEPVKNWQSNPQIDAFIKQVNSRIQHMNLLMPPKEDLFWVVSDKGRLTVFFFAALLMVLAVSGTVGEAAFQYINERDGARDKARASSEAGRPETNQSPTIL